MTKQAAASPSPATPPIVCLSSPATYPRLQTCPRLQPTTYPYPLPTYLHNHRLPSLSTTVPTLRPLPADLHPPVSTDSTHQSLQIPPTAWPIPAYDLSPLSTCLSPPTTCRLRPTSTRLSRPPALSATVCDCPHLCPPLSTRLSRPPTLFAPALSVTCPVLFSLRLPPFPSLSLDRPPPPR